MSLCILLRTFDGGALMATDSAVSVEYKGITYRVENVSDHEKIIVHLGYMIFCSGNMDRCKAIRAYIKNKDIIDYEDISSYAQNLWRKDTYDNSTGLFICAPDNSLIGMLSAQNFKIKELPVNSGSLDVQTLGFRMNEAYEEILKQVRLNNIVDAVITSFNSVACEEVGGTVHLFSRQYGGDIVHHSISLSDPLTIRKGVFV